MARSILSADIDIPYNETQHQLREGAKALATVGLEVPFWALVKCFICFFFFFFEKPECPLETKERGIFFQIVCAMHGCFS